MKRIFSFFKVVGLSLVFSAFSHADSTVPIVFHEDYDYKLDGFEAFNPFTNKKYSKILDYLLSRSRITDGSWFSPTSLSIEELGEVHSGRYLLSLEKPSSVFNVFERFDLDDHQVKDFNRKIGFYSNQMIYSQTLGAGGTLLAAELALAQPGHGWAINLSGGYHHAHAQGGSGFCLINDVAYVIKKVLKAHPEFRILIVDLDAHHGDGNAAILENELRVRIFDIFNNSVFPYNTRGSTPPAKNAPWINPIRDGTSDRTYLSLLRKNLPEAIEQLQPQLIFYNAGTDVYKYDPLGRLKISAQGIITRDELVFKLARDHGIPIVMVLSGGYATGNYLSDPKAKDIFTVIGESIENLMDKGLIPFQQPEPVLRSPQRGILFGDSTWYDRKRPREADE